MFTKQHFVAIATAFRESMPPLESKEYYGWRAALTRVCSEFKKDNAKFNVDKFITYITRE
jgi:hypothetical protein